MSARAGLLLLACGACASGERACAPARRWPGPPAIASATAAPPDPPLPVPDPPPAPAAGAHPRILLTPERVAAVRALRDAASPAWTALAAACDEDAASAIPAGYEAWDWAHATLDLALCEAVSTRPAYAQAAIRYFRALLDDRTRVGDGEGGDAIVHHDHGYGIRARGALGGVALDWLHDAPGMTPELRRHAVDRLDAWTRWFAASGYNRDHPIANYYAGWFGALAFGGIAADGDDPADPRPADWRRRARRMYALEIAPAFRQRLAGGDFPEGWQYGDMVGAFLALYADAESRSAAARSPFEGPFDVLPWLRQTVAFRTHALWPDGRHMLDTGDWSRKPAVAPPHTMLALGVVLPADNPAARSARWLAHLAQDARGEEWRWLAALGGAPPAEPPRPEAASYFAEGTGTVLARTDWSPEAIWFAMASAPSLSDHQHLDAGHFEVVRGGDALVVDAGGYGSYSSLSHNVIAVDDHKENDTYAPNQAVWSDRAGVLRHADDGRFVYALADYTSAYNPAGYPKDHPARSVTGARREVVFSRTPVPGLGPSSARLVVYDRVTVAKRSYGVTFLLHGAGGPLPGEEGSFRFVSGGSAAFAIPLLPSPAVPAVVDEPTALGDGPYYANDPPEGTTSRRLELRSRTGDLERRFLSVIAAGDAAGARPEASLIEAPSADGAVMAGEAFVFAQAAAVEYRAPATAVTHLVASLPPEAPYAVSARAEGDACKIVLTPGRRRDAGTPEAISVSEAGTLVISLGSGCIVQPSRHARLEGQAARP